MVMKGRGRGTSPLARRVDRGNDPFGEPILPRMQQGAVIATDVNNFNVFLEVAMSQNWLAHKQAEPGSTLDVVEVGEFHLAPQLRVQCPHIPYVSPVPRAWENLPERALLRLQEVLVERVEGEVELQGRKAKNAVKPRGL